MKIAPADHAVSMIKLRIRRKVTQAMLSRASHIESNKNIFSYEALFDLAGKLIDDVADVMYLEKKDGEIYDSLCKAISIFANLQDEGITKEGFKTIIICACEEILSNKMPPIPHDP